MAHHSLSSSSSSSVAFTIQTYHVNNKTLNNTISITFIVRQIQTVVHNNIRTLAFFNRLTNTLSGGESDYAQYFDDTCSPALSGVF